MSQGIRSSACGKAADIRELIEPHTQADPELKSSRRYTNWSADLDLSPGTNYLAAYAVDAAGNQSTNKRVTFFYVFNAPLTVSTNGKGGITPAYNGTLLPVGRNFTLTAKPGLGFRFTNWTDAGANIVTDRPFERFFQPSPPSSLTSRPPSLAS